MAEPLDTDAIRDKLSRLDETEYRLGHLADALGASVWALLDALDEARAEAVDRGEWTKTYGWRFRDGSPGSMDGLPTRPASPTGRLVATEQDHWHGPVRDCADAPVDVVGDNGSGT